MLTLTGLGLGCRVRWRQLIRLGKWRSTNAMAKRRTTGGATLAL